MSSFRIALAIYIFLLLSGGIIGYISSQSMVSLIMSSVFSSLLLLSLLISLKWVDFGLRFAFSLVAILTLFFAYRWYATAAFFPAGFFAALSLGISIAIGYKLLKK